MRCINSLARNVSLVPLSCHVLLDSAFDGSTYKRGRASSVLSRATRAVSRARARWSSAALQAPPSERVCEEGVEHRKGVRGLIARHHVAGIVHAKEGEAMRRLERARRLAVHLPTDRLRGVELALMGPWQRLRPCLIAQPVACRAPRRGHQAARVDSSQGGLAGSSSSSSSSSSG